ncbi:MAG: hypothetical protein HONBIEJF_02054 [Fimbriimonadaceae bacterium]|nr:hypothetical protein [Fimbriimonadaceae bacterium]
MLLSEGWTVDYGNGPKPCTVPHAWRQDVPVSWEGPAIYRNRCVVPETARVMRFEGVSYQARVIIEGQERVLHHGIWDAFDLPVEDLADREIEIEVHVTKNGGGSFPVREVLSGFLPYVFHTFGGIFRPVRWLANPVQHEPGPSRVDVRGSQIWADGKPIYVRGVLHWGWYPELGHPHPSRDVIEREVTACKRLGFNLVKFCLWAPPHEFLEVLDEHGMWGWMELPLWDPSSDPDRLAQMADEIGRIVDQYRHHSNILLWTAGCELSHATPAEYRCRLVEMIKQKTGSPLVRDNSGGAEMYGGDLREFGDFWDFHPYCDTPFYPEVLDSLQPGPRPGQPVLLGEFNDIDVHRDFGWLQRERPYWASAEPDLNDVGVRWQHDLPGLLADSPFAQETDAALMESSRSKAAFMREWVQQEVAARDWASGYVVTGIRDTPVSASGMFDDQGNSRYLADLLESPWNTDLVLFRIPHRRPPWVRGGNRPGWLDTANAWEGDVLLRLGLQARVGFQGGVEWCLLNSADRPPLEGVIHCEVEALGSREIGQIATTLRPGDVLLRVSAGSASQNWRLGVWPQTDWPDAAEFKSYAGDLPDPWTFGRLTVFRSGELVRPMPFWREAAYDYPVASTEVDLIKDQWHRLLPISGDVAFDEGALERALPSGYEVLMRRIDTRTYRTNPVVVRHGNGIWTTLRPFGGLGRQPSSLATNPLGATLALALGR